MLELIKAALWPAIALVAIILFYSPIRAVLDNISSRANEIEKIRLGSLELSVKVADLPTADPATARAIVKLDNDTLIELFSLSQSGVGGSCYNETPINKSPRYTTDKTLSELSLITWTAGSGSSNDCKRPYDIKLTDLGLNVRDYLLSLLTAQVRKAGYAPAAPAGR
jgi:hypothetical protein